MSQTQQSSSSTDDSANSEHLGWALLNVETGAFVREIGSGLFNLDTALFPDREDAIEFSKEHVEPGDTHLRVVSVSTDRYTDVKVQERVREAADGEQSDS